MNESTWEKCNTPFLCAHNAISPSAIHNIISGANAQGFLWFAATRSELVFSRQDGQGDSKAKTKIPGYNTEKQINKTFDETGADDIGF